MKEEISNSVVGPLDKSDINKFWFHVPPDITLSLEQSTILIVVGIFKVA